MPQVQTTQAEEEAKAKARVELFRTQAVGIVDRAANGEMFLALKSMENETPSTAAAPAEAQKAPEPPPAPAMKMSSPVKAAMTEALGAVLDTCAKMAEAIEKAEVDEAAPAPAELLKMAADAADKLDSMCEPYEAAEMAAPPPPAPEGEPAQKAAPPPPPPEPRRRMAMKRIMAMDGVAKALAENASKVGELVAWAKGAAGMAPPAMADKGIPAQKADIDPYTAMAATADAIRERMYCIRDLLEKDPAAVAAELRAMIPMVDSLNVLAAQARAGALAPPAAPAPAAASPAPAPPAMTEEAQMAVQKAISDGITAMKADLLSAMKADLSGLVLAAKGAAAQAQAALTKVEKSVPAPNGRPVGETPPPPAEVPLQADPWRQAAQEIQETSQARRRPATGK